MKKVNVLKIFESITIDILLIGVISLFFRVILIFLPSLLEYFSPKFAKLIFSNPRICMIIWIIMYGFIIWLYFFVIKKRLLKK